MAWSNIFLTEVENNNNGCKWILTEPSPSVNTDRRKQKFLTNYWTLELSGTLIMLLVYYRKYLWCSIKLGTRWEIWNYVLSFTYSLIRILTTYKRPKEKFLKHLDSAMAEKKKYAVWCVNDSDIQKGL